MVGTVSPCILYINSTTTQTYTLSLHDALPIYPNASDLRLERRWAAHNFTTFIQRCLLQFPDKKIVLVGSADRKSTRLNSSHVEISYAVFCLKKNTDAGDRTNDSIRIDGHEWWERLVHVFFILILPPPRPTLFPYTTLFRSIPTPPTSASSVVGQPIILQRSSNVACSNFPIRK